MSTQPLESFQTSKGRQVRVTERAQYREHDVLPPQTAQAAKKGKRPSANAPPKQPEFQISTLPENTTAKRGKTINLQARVASIATPSRTAGPATPKVAGQRRAIAAPTEIKPKLSAAATHEIQGLRNPYLSPRAYTAGATRQGAHTGMASKEQVVSTQRAARVGLGYGQPVAAAMVTASRTQTQARQSGAEGLFSDGLEVDAIEHPVAQHFSRHASPSHQLDYEPSYSADVEQGHEHVAAPEAGPFSHTGRRHARGDSFDDVDLVVHKQRRLRYHPDRDGDDEAHEVDNDPEADEPDNHELDCDGDDISGDQVAEIDLPIAQRIREPDGKCKAGDYDSTTQEVLTLAVRLYKGRVSSGNAFPGKMDELRWAKESWTTARHELEIQLQHNSELIKLITGYTANLRGEIKTVARDKVADAYGFEISANPTVLDRNRARVSMLRTNDMFVWRKRGKDLLNCRGLYEAKIFQTIANKVYFKGPADDAVALRDIYEPFPLVGIALIATAVQCAIDEWARGSCNKIAFSDGAYNSEYLRHLRNLEGYAGKCPEIVDSVCRRLFEDGCVAAGVKLSKFAEAVPDVMGEDVFARAAADFEARGGRLSDCEDEDELDDN